jgi:hypothetical protein
MGAPVYRRGVVWIACAVVFAGGAFVGGSGTVIVAVIRAYSGDTVYERSFDSRRWLAQGWQATATKESNFHTIRQEMVDDLLARHLHAGLSQDEVLRILGPSEPDPYFKSPDPEAWIYWLGAERGVGVDSEWLFVSFDGQGNLRRAFLATD